MSVTRFKLVRANVGSPSGGVSVPLSVADSADVVTATGGSQQSTLTGSLGQVWEIQTMTAAVEVVFGADPTAAAGATSRKLAVGQIYHFGVSASGEKCAVILAS